MFHLKLLLKPVKVVLVILLFFLISPNLLSVNAQTTPILHGGKENDYAYSVIQTMDGGYAIAGYTTSSGAGGKDFLLVKTKSDGTPEWSITYGGQGDEIAYSVLQTEGGDYLLVGSTTSWTNGGLDCLIVQIDQTGKEIERNQTYGGSGDDVMYQIVESSSSYALVGRTSSYGAGGNDFWLIKINSELGKEMEKWYGGSSNDVAESIVHIGDGKYVIVGYSTSYGVNEDLWCIRTDSAGKMDLYLTLGGPGHDGGHSIIQIDGGYAIAGYKSFDANNVRDFWLVKISDELKLEYEQTFGEPDQENGAWSIGQMSDGGYVLAGYTYSANMKYDIMLVKAKSDGSEDWKKTYGSSGDEIAESVVLPRDDVGIVVAGFTSSYGTNDDFYLLKTYTNGDLQWSQTYGEDINPPPFAIDSWHLIVLGVVGGIVSVIVGWRITKWRREKETKVIPILPEGWQFYEGLTEGSPPGTVFRVSPNKKKHFVGIIEKPKYEIEVIEKAEEIGKYTQEASMNTLIQFTGLKTAQVSANIEDTQKLTLEMPKLIRETVCDITIDPLVEKLIEDKRLRIRKNDKYFVIREARKTMEINYKLSKGQVESLGGDASLKKIELKAKNLSYLKRRHLIKQKFEKPMRVMFISEEVKIKVEDDGKVKVIH